LNRKLESIAAKTQGVKEGIKDAAKVVEGLKGMATKGGGGKVEGESCGLKRIQ